MAQAGRYFVITGRYRIRNPGAGSQPRPDGDTVSFNVDNPAIVKALPRFGDRPPKISASNGVSLRLESIDALETHFLVKGGEVKQAPKLAEQARGYLLGALGFKNVVFDDRGVVTAADAFEMPGYILANGIEENGRVVSYVYTGSSKRPDGTQVYLNSPEMERSANAGSLKRGFAYATLYETQPQELIVRSRKIAAKARAAKKGVFGAEDVGVGATHKIAGLPELQTLVMMPKLFRRLATYFAETSGELAGFDAWVRADPKRDDRLLLPTGEIGNLHDLYVLKRGGLALKIQPEDVTVLA